MTDREKKPALLERLLKVGGFRREEPNCGIRVDSYEIRGTLVNRAFCGVPASLPFLITVALCLWVQCDE